MTDWWVYSVIADIFPFQFIIQKNNVNIKDATQLGCPFSNASIYLSMFSLFLLQPKKKTSLTGGILQSATLSGDNFSIISDADSIKTLAVSKPLFTESILLCLTCKIKF